MEAHSLFELNEYIRRVVALNFREPIWIKAEANQVNFSRNNYYLDLVEKEKGKDNIVAKANGVLWARNYFFLKKKLGDVIDKILVDGTEILIKVKVDFNERYGMKLQIEDIDPAYTFGQTEIRRQEIIDRIKTEELHELNKQFALPHVIQRVAVLSSGTAAGYQDFVNQLRKNSYGYDFNFKLFEIPVQGALLESKFLEAMDLLDSVYSSFDIAVIVRGGGSRLDLSWFDTYKIAHKISEANLPIITGIGHDIDHSIADIVAHTYVKTPTAAADFILEHNLLFESQTFQLLEQIVYKSQSIINDAASDLEVINHHINSSASQKIQSAKNTLEVTELNLENVTLSLLSKSEQQLFSLEKLIKSVDPDNVLARGYAAVYKNGKSVNSSRGIKINEEFIVKMSDGQIVSKKVK